MFRYVRTLAATAAVVLIFSAVTAAEKPQGGVGIDERLGSFVPLDLGFLDSSGDSVYLRQAITRPTILTLVYYHCPTICKPLLGEVAHVVARTELVPGEDYNLLTVSFNSEDTPETARTIKENFTESLDTVGENGWRFLTADSATIAALTEAVGFSFERTDGDTFAHGTALIVLSPEGKIVRYLYGIRFLPFDIKMAVTEATKGNVAPSIARVLQYCFSYDPDGRRYVFNVTRVAGAGILLFAFGWVVYMGAGARRHRGKV